MQTSIIASLVWPRAFYSHQRKNKCIIIVVIVIIISKIHYSLYKSVKRGLWSEILSSDEHAAGFMGLLVWWEPALKIMKSGRLYVTADSANIYFWEVLVWC